MIFGLLVTSTFRDSTGNLDPVLYNAAHWDGVNWTVLRIPYYYLGQPFYSPIYSVFTFDEGNIWFGIGIMIHWDGQNYNPVQLPPGIWTPQQMNKIWGKSDGSLYVVGEQGGIAFRSPTGSWQRVTSGTSLPIRHVLGMNNNSARFEVLGVSDSYGDPHGSEVLLIDGLSARSAWNDGRPFGLDGIWFVPDRRYVAVGAGVWQTRSLESPWALEHSPPHITSIDGNQLNDYVIVGAFMHISHFDGLNWHVLMSSSSGSLTSVQMRDDMFVTVGSSGPKPIAVRATRQ